MAIESIDLLHGIVNGSTQITELTNCRVSPMIQAFLARSSGQMDPQFAANMEQKPEITFETQQLKTVLDLTGVGVADLSGGNTDLFFRAALAQGGRTDLTSTAHKRYRLAQGLLAWERISVTHNGDASISCRLLAGFDGTNSPIVYAGSVAADSVTPSSPDHWTVGPCYVNGTQITGVQGIGIDRGGRLFQLGGEGEQYPTFQGEQTSDPVVTIVTPKTSFWSDLGLNGAAIASASIYLRKIGTTARIANNVASHVKFAAAAGLAVVEDTAGDAENPAMTTIKLYLAAASATARALVLTSTGVAITT